MVFQPEETFKIRNHEITAARILRSLSQQKNGLWPPRIRTPTYTTFHLWDVLTIASSSPDLCASKFCFCSGQLLTHSCLWFRSTQVNFFHLPFSLTRAQASTAKQHRMPASGNELVYSSKFVRTRVTNGAL